MHNLIAMRCITDGSQHICSFTYSNLPVSGSQAIALTLNCAKDYPTHQ